MAVMIPSSHGSYSPTIISKEALIARQAALVMMSRVLRKDRDAMELDAQINVPEVANLTTNAVGADGSYNPQAPADVTRNIVINQFRESSFSVRDDLQLQSRLDRFKAYSPKVGYALALYAEDQILAEETNVTQVIDIAADIVDANLRRLKQYLDDVDAPANDRHVIVSPGQANGILAIDRYANADFMTTARRAGPLETGRLIPLLGMEPLMSTRVRRRDISGTTRTINMAWHKEAFAAAMQKNVAIKVIEIKLAKDYVGWNLFGTVTTRPNHAALARTVNA